MPPQSCPKLLCLLAGDVDKFLCQRQMMLQLTGRLVSGAMHLESPEAGAPEQLRFVALHALLHPAC